MKDFGQIWRSVAGRTYSAVNRADHHHHHHHDHAKDNRKARNRIIFCAVMSVVSLLVGLFIYFVEPYDKIFKWKVIFAEGGEIYEMWRKPAVDLYIRIYLFNVTNADDFLAGKDILRFNQVGPYVYKEILEHSNVTFNTNGTLNSVPLHPLEWQVDESYPRREDDKLILPHIAMLSIGHVVSTGNFITKMGLNALLKTTGTKPLLEMTAKDFMFGYQSTLVTLGNSVLPRWIKFDKLGLIDRMYDFDTDFETVYTGETNESYAGLMDKWRGERHLPHWKGEHCSKIHLASDGSKFPGNLNPHEEILFYRKSLCRAAPMVKTDEGNVNGLFAYKYMFEKNALDNGHRDHRNKCFCRKGNCLPDGLIDVTDCYYGFPIALSYPHFLNASPELKESVGGMEPDEKLHSSYVWLQPKSGLPLEVAKRFQINMALTTDLKSIYGLSRFSKSVIPLLWFEIRMFKLPYSMANLFKLYLSILPTAEQVLMWFEFAAAPILAILSIFLIRRRPTTHNPSRRPSNYVRSLRKMSQDLEAKIHGIYVPCEIPLNDGNDSASPFLEETDTDEKVEDRRPSLIKIHTDKIKEFGNRIQENIKNLTDKLMDDKQSDSDEANSNGGFNTDSGQSSGEDGMGNYKHVQSSDEDNPEADDVDLEIVDDGSEFDTPFDDIQRRRSVELTRMENRMNRLESVGNINLSKLPFLREDQV